mmetsp:Transcript_25284/g.49415  ORF Transcript_25284/g.49415 Transcript_25284/m.49415 type:complete len:144 (-) Transcript_25284:2201-2632(-)
MRPLPVLSFFLSFSEGRKQRSGPADSDARMNEGWIDEWIDETVHARFWRLLLHCPMTFVFFLPPFDTSLVFVWRIMPQAAFASLQTKSGTTPKREKKTKPKGETAKETKGRKDREIERKKCTKQKKGKKERSRKKKKRKGRIK